MGPQKFDRKFKKPKMVKSEKCRFRGPFLRRMVQCDPKIFLTQKSQDFWNSSLRTISGRLEPGKAFKNGPQNRQNRPPEQQHMLKNHFSKIAHISKTCKQTHQFYWRNRLISTKFTVLANKNDGFAKRNRLKSGPRKSPKNHKNSKIFLASLGPKIAHISITFLPSAILSPHIRAIQTPILTNITKYHTTW